MLPAFQSRLGLYGFGGTIAGLLVLPVLLPSIGLPSREELWCAPSPKIGGAVGAYVRTTYLDDSDADIVFLGSSMTQLGIRPDIVQAKATAMTGKKTICRVFAIPDRSQDIQYFALRDYLSRHRTKLVAIELPHKFNENTEPDNQTYRYLRFGEYSDATKDLGFRFNLQEYGEFVLGGVNQLLWRLRPNLLSAEEISDKEIYGQSRDKAFDGGAFAVYTSAAATAQAVSFDSPLLQPTEPGPSPVATHWRTLMTELAEAHGAKVVFFRVPFENEYSLPHVPVQRDWNSGIGPNHQLIAIPLSELFKGLTRPEVDHFFMNVDHLNTNGAIAYSKAIAPVVARLYGGGG